MLNSILFGIAIVGFVGFMAYLAYDTWADAQKHKHL